MFFLKKWIYFKMKNIFNSVLDSTAIKFAVSAMKI